VLPVINQQVLNSLHEFPEDDTDVPKYVRVVKKTVPLNVLVTCAVSWLCK